MKIDPNDPRLTAYALGELDDDERVEIDALIKDDNDAQREVETIRRATTRVTEELQSESCPRLNPDQLAAIEERFSVSEKAAPAFPWWRILSWTAALGATAAVVVSMLLPSLNRSRPHVHTLALQTPASTPAPMEPAPLATSIPTPSGTVVPFDDEQNGAPAQGVGTRDSLGQPRQSSRKDNSGTILFDDNHARWDNNVPVSPTVAGSPSVEALSAEPSKDLYVYRRVQQQAVTTDGGQLDLSKSATRQFYQQNPPGAAPMGSTVAGSGADVQGRLVPYFGDIPRRGRLSGNRSADSRVEHWDNFADTATESLPSAVTESYRHLVENSFVAVSQNPLSTFSLDVDTASYANIRRFLNHGQRPPHDAVRIEEMLNYFPYNYPAPRGREPFSLYVEMAECPWNSAHRLALVALKAKDIPARKAQPMNLVFLIDVSGSMADANKLPLIKQSLRMLVEQLTPRDHVAIVVYAGDSRVALPSTSGDDKEAILEVIDSLEAGGSTNGGAGIQTAYREALSNFIEGGVNRVILCTDGDFNVGITDQGQLIRLIQQQAKSNVFLTILGVGMGNLKDSTMQKLADKGNGNYAYIDNLDEAHKVLAEQMRGTLVTVAKDAKVQIEFNPALVQSYRLIGYEKRMLRAQDFNNDRKDAGEVGAGHTVTALYEIVPAEAPAAPGVDPLKYQPQRPAPETAFSGEMMTVKLRYKEPEASSSQLLTASVKDQHTSWRGTSTDFRFAASVAAFGLILRDSPYKGAASCDLVLQLAEGARGYDPNGYRSEFIDMVSHARTVSGTTAVPDEP